MPDMVRMAKNSISTQCRTDPLGFKEKAGARGVLSPRLWCHAAAW